MMEEAQAIFYLRSKLIMGTMSVAGGIGMKYDLYYHHPISDATVGFHINNSDNDWYGTVRKIQHASALLHSATRELQFGYRKTKPWIPVNYDGPYGQENDEYYAWCGWQTEGGQKWGAIWQFRNESISFSSINLEERDFIIEDELLTGSVTVYEIDFSEDIPDELTQVDSFSITSQSHHQNGDTVIPIETDENPRFLKFNFN